MNKSLEKLYQEFVHFIQLIEPRSKFTVESYSRDVRKYLEYLELNEITNINDVTYEQLLNYIDDMSNKYSSATVFRSITAIRQFHQYLVRFGVLEHDISAYVTAEKRPKKLPHALTQEQLRQLLSFPKEEPKDYLDYALILVLFQTGMRVSECVNVQFTQYYQEEGWFRIIGKGNKERMVPVGKEGQEALDYYINNVRPLFEKKKTNNIFISKKGNKISRQYVHTMLQYRRNETGLIEAVSAHTLRHSLATEMLDEEVDLRIIQEILGHSDISTTQIYTHVRTKTMRDEYDQYFKDGLAFNDDKDHEGGK